MRRHRASLYRVGRATRYNRGVKSNNRATGYKDIIGLALATNTVTVNSGSADRKGEYFHKEISIANGSGPVWQSVSITAGGTTNGGLAHPASSQTMVYDADGNLTFDGIWNYSWDAENRLVSMNMTNISGIAGTNRLKLDFAYDYMNRRISKTVSTNSSGSTFVPQATNYFVYDGWNLIASFNPSGVIQQSFVWGLDLSGTLIKAGGIGGLAMLKISGTNQFAGYDGNGNLLVMVSSMDSSVTARNEYSPFGELLRATGPLAKANPFRFSTKFRDDESGLVYYGYRYYNPTQGRWIERDPAPDQLLELYCFNHNAAILQVDPDGRCPVFLIAVGAGAVIGGVIGAILNKDDHWLGFLEGATAGAIAPLAGIGLASGVSALGAADLIATTAGGATAGATGAYLRSVFDNQASGNANPFLLNTKQKAVVGGSAAFGVLLGAGIGYTAAAKGVDVDDQILDWTLTVAGEGGVAAAEAFATGAESGANAGQRLFQQHVNDLDGQ